MKKPPIIPFLRPSALAALLMLLAPRGGISGDAAGSAGQLARRPRQPVALACADGGKTVLVANRRS
jgi:hypothetical protein